MLRCANTLFRCLLALNLVVIANDVVNRWWISSHSCPGSGYLRSQPLPLWIWCVYREHLGVRRLRWLSRWQWWSGMSNRYFLFYSHWVLNNTIFDMMLIHLFNSLLGHSAVTPVATQAPLPSGRCAKDQFLCVKPQNCIANWKRCDGHPHCQDASDEANCRKCLWETYTKYLRNKCNTHV